MCEWVWTLGSVAVLGESYCIDAVHNVCWCEYNIPHNNLLYLFFHDMKCSSYTGEHTHNLMLLLMKKIPLTRFSKKTMRRTRWREGGKREGVSHYRQPAEGRRLPWFRSVLVVAGVAGVAGLMGGRKAAGCLTAADGAAQGSKNTQTLSLAYMCHSVFVIIVVHTSHTYAHTHRCKPDSAGSYD